MSHLHLIAALPLLVACSKGPPPPAGPLDASSASVDSAASSGEDAPLDTSGPPPDTSAGATSAPLWVTLEPRGEGFRAEVPQVAVRSIEQVTGPQGHHTELIKYTVNRDDMVLIMTAAPAVEQLVAHGDKTLALERTMASQTQVAGRTVRYDKPLEVANGDAREAELDMTVDGQRVRLRARILLRDARMFQVLAIWPLSAATSETPPAVEHLFASYELTGDASAVGEPIDLWQAFQVPELGLQLFLPKAPEITSAEADTFVGKAIVTTAAAFSGFPISAYSIEVVAVPSAHADKRDDALVALWKAARMRPADGTTPKVITEEEVEFLGGKAPLLVLEEAMPDGQTRVGYLRLHITREGKKALKLTVASVWAMDAKLAPDLAARFFSGIKTL